MAVRTRVALINAYVPMAQTHLSRSTCVSVSRKVPVPPPRAHCCRAHTADCNTRARVSPHPFVWFGTILPPSARVRPPERWRATSQRRNIATRARHARAALSATRRPSAPHPAGVRVRRDVQRCTSVRVRLCVLKKNENLIYSANFSGFPSPAFTRSTLANTAPQPPSSVRLQSARESASRARTDGRHEHLAKHSEQRCATSVLTQHEPPHSRTAKGVLVLMVRCA